MSIQSLYEGFAACFLPPEELSTAEWSIRFRRLDSRAGSSRPGAWREEVAPYTRGVMDAFDDPAIEEVLLCWGAQLAKTETMLNCMLRCIDMDPANMMLVLPKEDVITEFVKTRLRPTIEGNPQVYRHVPDGDKTAMGQNGFLFKRCNLFFASMNQPSSLASKPIRYLFMDEIDKGPDTSKKNEGHWMGLAKQRTKTFWNRKIMMASTPTIEQGPVWSTYKSSDMRIWVVPCSSCNVYTEMRWEFMWWDQRPRDMKPIEFAKAMRMGKVAHGFKCPHCQSLHREGDKWELNLKGKWIAQADEGPTAGFQLSSMASNLYPWKDMIAGWYESQGDPLMIRNFINSELGLPYEEKGARSTVDIVLERRNDLLDRGVVPKWCKVLTAGFDVQGDCVHYSVWAWGERRRAHLVDDGTLPSLFGAEDVIGRRYTTDDGKERMIQATFMDSGFRTKEVYEFCATNLRSRVYPCKGDTKAGRKDPLYLSKAEVSFGDGAAGQIPLIIINTNAMKDLLHALTMREMEDEAHMSFHAQVTSDFADQFSAEERIDEKDGRGFSKFVWRKKAGSNANHKLDCSVYAFSAAEACGMGKWSIQERMNESKQGPEDLHATAFTPRANPPVAPQPPRPQAFRPQQQSKPRLGGW
jgi:phage terminase large subunit GpA-like protein